MNMTKRNLVTIYTGHGQGKTTAAWGLAVKALIDGKAVFIGQFVKSNVDLESKIAQKYDRLQVEQLGFEGFDDRQPNENDRAAALAAMMTGEEIIPVIGKQQVLDLLAQRPDGTEVVITGADAPQWLIDAADCVSAINELKHPANESEALLCDAIDSKN